MTTCFPLSLAYSALCVTAYLPRLYSNLYVGIRSRETSKLLRSLREGNVHGDEVVDDEVLP